MSNRLGDYSPGAVVYDSFTTVQPTTGAPFALAGTPILSVYKDDSATQWGTVISVGNGTLSNPDSVAGFNVWKIDTGADGAFFASGHTFHVVITTGTVDGVSVVGSVVASFTLGAYNTGVITESYRADNAAPTPAQFMCEVLAHLGEVGIVSTTKTINKFDGTTPAATFTLDSATAPTTITRAS
jgi:hypothetical protein